jgi:hypothetical protein
MTKINPLREGNKHTLQHLSQVQIQIIYYLWEFIF